jgi:hypothetical protein
MVVAEKLSKDAHFIPIKSTCKVIDIDSIFMKEIFILHGMPKEIISPTRPVLCLDLNCSDPEQSSDPENLITSQDGSWEVFLKSQ